MRVIDIIQKIEQVIPPGWAAEWDNIGLQTGDEQQPVRSVLVCLDVTPEVLKTAKEQQVDLIISHHPLLFSSVKHLRNIPGPEGMVFQAIQSGIAIYSVHTSFDSSPEFSMNRNIGELLGFRNSQPVSALLQNSHFKIQVFVPESSFDCVQQAMFQAGAGRIGHYSGCSFSTRGTGTFCGDADSQPTVGQPQENVCLEEIRLEMVCPPNCLSRVIAAMVQAHPYEQPAFDVLRSESLLSDARFLWWGEFPAPVTLETFARQVKQTIGLGKAVVRYCGYPGQPLHTAAWCCGGGKSLIPEVSRLGVDLYLTGDTGHHDGLAVLDQGIALMDVDHYFTEQFFMDNMRRLLMDNGCQVDIHIFPEGEVFHAV